MTGLRSRAVAIELVRLDLDHFARPQVGIPEREDHCDKATWQAGLCLRVRAHASMFDGKGLQGYRATVEWWLE